MNIAPPPLPGTNPSLFRAIRGPILLITLGLLIEIDHLGRLSFWRTWPVLLIVFGLLKLAEYAGTRSA